MTEIQELQKNIKELKAALEDKKKYTYVGETTSVYVMGDDLYIEYGSDGENTLIMGINQLFEDLPFITDQVLKQQKKQLKRRLKEIKKVLKN